MNISQRERGGNGESIEVVNQWLLRRAADLCRRGTNLLHQIISRLRFSIFQRNSFDCAASQSFCPSRGALDIAMIETVTAFMGLISASVFLAHAYDGFRSRA
jgi:hypothetical protein